MNYKQVEEYILNIPKFRAEGSIEQTRKFYEFLGKPGKNGTIVHVAGTNGKGSACAYMNSVLTEEGYQVGMFTSPHLVSVRERMRVGHTLISEQEFVENFYRLMEQIKRYDETNRKIEEGNKETEEPDKETQETNKKTEEDSINRILFNNIDKKEKRAVQEKETEIQSQVNYTPTFYEFLFFMAMLYFEEQKTDMIILETGLGGRLDATNVIDAPKVAVITEIGMDHMEYLGDTIAKIAEEKAGIIKKGSIVVYSANRQESAAVIERKAGELDVLCKSVEKLEKGDYRFVDKKIDFSFFSRYYDYIPIRLVTSAVYQIENATLALTAIEEIGVKISKESLQAGMEKCRWEGRMEEILPNVFLDGAHNEDGIDAFINSVRNDGCKGKRWLLFSALADKEYILMKEKLINSELFSYIYASPLNTVRGITKEELQKLFSDSLVSKKKSAAEKNIFTEDNRLEETTILCDGEEQADKVFADDKMIQKKTESENTISDRQVRITDSAYEGLQEILISKKEKDLVYVTGSLYLVGEIMCQMSD